MMAQRYLDAHESADVRGAGCHLRAFVLEFDGSIDMQILRHAYSLLCNKYPLLRACIRFEGEQYLLDAGSGRNFIFLARNGDISVLMQEIDEDFDLSLGVARLILIQGESGGYVALHISHIFTDGRACWAILTNLWTIYTRLVEDGQVSVGGEEPLPQPMRELLRKRWSAAQVPSSSSRQDGKTVAAGTVGGYQRVRLCREETHGLISAAHALKTSVHALVSGAILLALRMNDERVGSIPMVCQSVIDLRNRVTPPVGPTEATNFFVKHHAELSVDRGADAVDVGREVKRQLDIALASPERLFEPDSNLRVERFLERGAVCTEVTNPGVVPNLTVPDGLRFTDFMWLGKIVLSVPMHIVQTFDGRLSVTAQYPSHYRSQSDADSVIGQAADYLRSMALKA